MKKFFLNLAFLALLAAIGFLGVRLVQTQRSNAELRETITGLETQRRDLEQQLATAQRAPKPEEQSDERHAIEQQTSELRELPFKHPVNYKMIERAKLREILLEKVREQFTEQELHDYGRTLAAIGLVPEGTDLLSAILSLYDEQVAAFYVPEERSLYTFKDQVMSSGLDKMLLAHELTHALQDQTYDLTTFPLKAKDNDDLVLATAALIEGDATVLMTRWYVENVDPSRMLGDLGAMFRQNTAKLREAPAYLRDMLLFPYVQGQEFAMALTAHGGTKALDEAFRHPPRSTQEILHPEKFLEDRRDPVNVEVPVIAAKDWRLIGDNVLGEFGLRSLLQQDLPAFRAQLLAAGWNGDRYRVYERGPNGPTGLIWVTAWEDEAEATEFEEAYRTFIKKRSAADALEARVQHQGRTVTIQQSTDPAFFGLLDVAHAQ